jgi:type III secretion protein V
VKKLLQRAAAVLSSQAELVLPLAVAAILGALVVPLPAWLLDAGLALNLVAAAALLIAALQAASPLELSAFPTLLLVTTLFRLSLNVSSTRLALAEGHAGSIIQAFGEFVVRGDYLVGGVVFAVVTLVQFLVVAKGAERVSEVAARFTLDAMPGKQMAIDADLRSGVIDQATARGRRRSLERESQMFGAMDGAMKFVKGDVLAGLVIVLVNLVGGLLVGVLQRGLEPQQALATYALIAIGDGLSSQVPSLCIAVAAGLVVTRVASDEEGTGLGRDIGLQFFSRPAALPILGGVAAALALVPGMPRATFVLLALGLGGTAWWRRRKPDRPSADAAAGDSTPPAEASAVEAPLVVPPLSLDLAPGWVDSPERARLFQESLRQMRRALERDLGFRCPGVHVRTGADLATGSRSTRCQPVEVGFLSRLSWPGQAPRRWLSSTSAPSPSKIHCPVESWPGSRKRRGIGWSWPGSRWSVRQCWWPSTSERWPGGTPPHFSVSRTCRSCSMPWRPGPPPWSGRRWRRCRCPC